MGIRLNCASFTGLGSARRRSFPPNNDWLPTCRFRKEAASFESQALRFRSPSETCRHMLMGESLALFYACAPPGAFSSRTRGDEVSDFRVQYRESVALSKRAAPYLFPLQQYGPDSGLRFFLFVANWRVSARASLFGDSDQARSQAVTRFRTVLRTVLGQGSVPIWR